jgi:hypothetical protein
MHANQFLFRIFVWIPFTSIISLYILIATTSYTLDQAATVLLPICKLSQWTSNLGLCLFFTDSLRSSMQEALELDPMITKLMDRLIRDEFIHKSPHYSLATHAFIINGLRMGSADGPGAFQSHLQVKWNKLWEGIGAYRSELESVMANNTLHALR